MRYPAADTVEILNLWGELVIEGNAFVNATEVSGRAPFERAMLGGNFVIRATGAGSLTVVVRPGTTIKLNNCKGLCSGAAGIHRMERGKTTLIVR